VPEWIQTIADWLAVREVRAIIISLILSWGITQFVKNAPSLVAMPERHRRFWTRVLAFFLSALPAVALWPGDWVERLGIGMAIGFASPVIYTYGARVLYHFFPWLEIKMSATPAVPADECKP